jgi:Ca2+-binding RTX toxin-like protein
VSTTHYITSYLDSNLLTGTGDRTYEAAGVVIAGDIDMQLQSDDMTPDGGGDQVVTLEGGVLGEVDDDEGATSGNDQILIGTTGYVINDSLGGVELAGGGNTLTNNGSISSAFSGDVVLISNALGIDQSDEDTIVNTGVISGSQEVGVTGSCVVDCMVASISLTNSGSILSSGGAIGVYIDSSKNGGSFLNTGLITGGVELVGDALAIHNSGTIEGALSMKGLISGAAVNDGAIYGNVSLGGGHSSFDSTDGKVYGTISAGAGGDTIVAGQNGGSVIGGAGADTLTANPFESTATHTTLAGGAGHDQLYGGPGFDTFVFSSYAAANSDTIHGFDVAQDRIELAHSAFTTLVAGKTPVFSIGAQATGPTDHLFYNSKTGGLYYDVNGNAAGGSYLVADMATGLKLTTSDFTIV